MEIRVCPECDRAFYTAAVEYPPPCPHCGHELLNRRKQETAITVKDFTLLSNLTSNKTFNKK
jgi:DNA-directed RNA polymerase subunit RPC12/RpoP